jgi:integrase
VPVQGRLGHHDTIPCELPGINSHEHCAAYADFAAKIGLARIRFHDLRHSHASQLLRQRVPVKTVQERLGHANATITLNTYAHVLAGDDQLAVENFELKLRLAMEKQRGRKAN